MGKRCCIDGCKRKKGEKVGGVYRFPAQGDEERERWLQLIPPSLRKSDITDESVVCRRHWPEDAKFTTNPSSFGKIRPVDPPSIFNGVKKELPPLRTTMRALAEERRPLPTSFRDQETLLKETDSVTFEQLQHSLIDENKKKPPYTTVFMLAGILFIQSMEFISGIPKFLIKISPSLKFETFHGGVKCFVTSLTANRITKLDSWSRLEEAIRFLRCRDNSRHQDVLHEQVEEMHP